MEESLLLCILVFPSSSTLQKRLFLLEIEKGGDAEEAKEISDLMRDAYEQSKPLDFPSIPEKGEGGPPPPGPPPPPPPPGGGMKKESDQQKKNRLEREDIELYNSLIELSVEEAFSKLDSMTESDQEDFLGRFGEHHGNQKEQLLSWLKRTRKTPPDRVEVKKSRSAPKEEGTPKKAPKGRAGGIQPLWDEKVIKAKWSLWFLDWTNYKTVEKLSVYLKNCNVENREEVEECISEITSRWDKITKSVIKQIRSLTDLDPDEWPKSIKQVIKEDAIRQFMIDYQNRWVERPTSEDPKTEAEWKRARDAPCTFYDQSKEDALSRAVELFRLNSSVEELVSNLGPIGVLPRNLVEENKVKKANFEKMLPLVTGRLSELKNARPETPPVTVTLRSSDGTALDPKKTYPEYTSVDGDFRNMLSSLTIFKTPLVEESMWTKSYKKVTKYMEKLVASWKSTNESESLLRNILESWVKSEKLLSVTLLSSVKDRGLMKENEPEYKTIVKGVNRLDLFHAKLLGSHGIASISGCLDILIEGRTPQDMENI